MATRTQKVSENRGAVVRSDLRHGVYHRDGYCCAYCGRDLSAAADAERTLDHVVPAAWFQRRGRPVDNSPKNLVLACVTCNSSRRDVRLAVWATPAQRREVYRRVKLPFAAHRAEGKKIVAERAARRAA